MLGQSLYIKSRGPGQLTLGLGRWEVTREVGVGRVYAGLRRAGERGNVCVCLRRGDRARMFVSACCQMYAAVAPTPCGKVYTPPARSYAKEGPAFGRRAGNGCVPLQRVDL